MRVLHIESVATKLLVIVAVMSEVSSLLQGDNLLTNTFNVTLDREREQDREWSDFKSNFGKVYSNLSKEIEAYTNFLENIARVTIQNTKYALKLSTYYSRLNGYSDINAAAFIKAISGFIPSADRGSDTNSTQHSDRSKRSVLPNRFDWHEKGKTSPVKDQRTCGSCYCFAATGVLESQLMLRNVPNALASEQQILDCSSSYGNSGCIGGSSGVSFKYIKANAGLVSSSCNPYQNRQSKTCTKQSSIALIDNYYKKLNIGVQELKELLVSYGPVAVAVNFIEEMNEYGGGVFSDCSAKTSFYDLNHAVLLVGYDTINGIDCWKIKNSFGTQWGENGYIYIDQSKDCGITQEVDYATII